MKDMVDIDIRVRYAETDQMGVAYYANYLVWFEVGGEFCRRKGFNYSKLESLGYRLVVTDAHCHYRNSARYDELVTVRTWLKEVRKRMITFGYHILRRDRGKEELIAEGETRHVNLDSNGAPKSLPKEFLIFLFNDRCFSLFVIGVIGS
jgi:acyl-CoA thioester hydrolase